MANPTYTQIDESEILPTNTPAFPVHPKRAQIFSCVFCEFEPKQTKGNNTVLYLIHFYLRDADTGSLLLLLLLPRGVGYLRPQTALKEFKPVVSSQHVSTPRSRVTSFVVQFTSL